MVLPDWFSEQGNFHHYFEIIRRKAILSSPGQGGGWPRLALTKAAGLERVWLGGPFCCLCAPHPKSEEARYGQIGGMDV
jgi:hypothetical protein